MRKKGQKQNSQQMSENQRYDAVENNDEDGTEGNIKGDKKMNDQYKCGKAQCGKLYHSYTAFYNHCKKSHDGIFPPESLHNNKIFQGPSKNRGRPRIKKTDVKDSVQIQSLKTENQLIQFLGTLPKRKKNQQLIVYVANPIEQLDNAIDTLLEYRKDVMNQIPQNFIFQLKQLNMIVSENDLPDFYDPIQISKYSDKMDSYNFLSIYNFLTDPSKNCRLSRPDRTINFLRKILIIWLTRIVSVPLLAQVVYTMAQISKGLQKIDQQQYMLGKTGRFKQLVEKYFQCVLNQQLNSVKYQVKQEYQ